MNSFENPLAQNKATQDVVVQKSKSSMTANEVFERYLKKDEKIEMRDFRDIYGAEDVKKDLDRVAYVKNSKGFEKPTSESVVLENMFSDLVEKYNWFGQGVKSVQLSEFDDMIASGAHCDVVLEIPTNDGKCVRIGVDLTTAINYDTLSKKRTKCIEGIQSGKLFSVKYFKSKIDDTKGRISNVPVFFAGLDRNTLQNLCETMAKQENAGSEILEKHEGQFVFLDEILSQSNRFIAVARVRHGEQAGVTKWMEYYKELFKWILDNKKSPRPNNFGQRAGQDEVYRYITKFV